MRQLTSHEIAEEILLQLDKRGPGKTICPSEVARAIAPDGWRDLMGSVRAVAAELVKEGRITVTRSGTSVDPLNPGGPIRLGKLDLEGLDLEVGS